MAARPWDSGGALLKPRKGTSGAKMHLLGRSCARHKDVVALGLQAATAARVAAEKARYSGGRLHTASERKRTAKRMWLEGKQMHFFFFAAVFAEQGAQSRGWRRKVHVFVHLQLGTGF